MTSKNSFLASMNENNKRRLWVWMLSALFFVLVLPVSISITVSQQINDKSYLIETYGAELAEQALHERLINSMCGQLGFSGMLVIFATIIAVISGIHGFSYLYSRKKIDFYMGMPVKRKKRFLIIWLNGIILYVIPCLLGLAISLMIAAGNGAVDGRVLLTTAAAFGINFLYYLCIYHMAILALMLTGNFVITALGFLVFCLYEFAVRGTLYEYKSMFFRYFSYHGSGTTPKISPFTWYSGLADIFNYENAVEIRNLAGLVIFALAVGGVSYVCYLKRPAEAAGRAMTFGVTRPVIKVALTVPMALLSGILIAGTVNYTPTISQKGIGYVIFTIAVMVVLASCLIQVIYEFDIKGVFHKKLHILVSGVIVALIFLTFRYDLLGYDSYIPKPGRVESVAFIPSYYETTFGGGARFDADGSYLSDEEYAEKYMFLGKAEEVCELAEHSMSAYNRLAGSGYNLDDTEDTSRWSAATLLYRLKGGREVYRRIWVDVEDDKSAALLDEIMGSAEFKKGYLPGASENLAALLEENGNYKINAGYGNMVYWEDMSQAEMKEFLQIYQKDLEKANFSNVKENLPVGIGRIAITEEMKDRASYYARSTRSWYVGMNVYPFYEDSIDWLKTHGYYRDSQLNPEDVEHIQIVNNNREIYDELVEKQKMTAGAAALGEAEQSVVNDYYGTKNYGEDTIDTRVYRDYTDKEQILKISNLIYPQDLVDNDWDYGIGRDEDYVVYVYFKADSPLTKKYGSSVSYVFPEGMVPEFVKSDTLYRE